MIPKLAKKVLGISLQSTSSLKFTGNATGLVWHAKLHHVCHVGASLRMTLNIVHIFYKQTTKPSFVTGYTHVRSPDFHCGYHLEI
jgi:hypothetical protein